MNFPNISDKNKHIQTICTYTLLYGYIIPKNDEVSILTSICRHELFCVYITPKGIEKQLISQPSNRITQLIGMHMKRAKVLLFVGGNFREITPENFGKMRRYFAPKPKAEYLPEKPQYIKTRKDDYFADGMPQSPYKKPSKRGFYRTERANYKCETMHYYNAARTYILAAY